MAFVVFYFPAINFGLLLVEKKMRFREKIERFANNSNCWEPLPGVHRDFGWNAPAGNEKLGWEGSVQEEKSDGLLGWEGSVEREGGWGKFHRSRLWPVVLRYLFCLHHVTSDTCDKSIHLAIIMNSNDKWVIMTQNSLSFKRVVVSIRKARYKRLK